MNDKQPIKGCWAFIYPSGRVLVDSAFRNAGDAWKVGLGWPDSEEIERAKKAGYQVKWVKVVYE